MTFVDDICPVPEVTIVVPCRNEKRYIHSFLESLQAQKTPGLTCEVMIADGMSRDGTREVLDEWARIVPGIRIIDNPESIVSTGLNRAILAAAGEIIIRLDVHTHYAPDYIASCVRILNETGASNVGGPMRNAGTGLVQRAIAAAFHSPFSCGGAQFHDTNYEGYVDTVTYGCWRKQTLLAVGLFDPALVRNQDDELNLRIIRSGGRIWQSPRIVMSYQPRDSLKALASQYFQYGYWKVAVIRKHRIPANWRHLVPGLFLLSVTVLSLAAGLSVLLKFPVLASACLLLWAATLATYLGAVALASVVTAYRNSWRLLPLLPIVFAIYHLSYGFGFLAAGFNLLSNRSSALRDFTSFANR